MLNLCSYTYIWWVPSTTYYSPSLPFDGFGHESCDANEHDNRKAKTTSMYEYMSEWWGPQENVENLVHLLWNNSESMPSIQSPTQVLLCLSSNLIRRLNSLAFHDIRPHRLWFRHFNPRLPSRFKLDWERPSDLESTISLGFARNYFGTFFPLHVSVKEPSRIPIWHFCQFRTPTSKNEKAHFKFMPISNILPHIRSEPAPHSWDFNENENGPKGMAREKKLG